MPAWVIYSLLASVSIAVVSVIDKSVLSNWMADARGSFFAFTLIEMLSGVIALLLLGLPVLPLGATVMALGTGAAFSLSTLFYFRAIQSEDVTRVVPLYNLAPIVVAVLAGAFLGEVFAPVKYLGILLIVAGAVLLTLKRVRGFRFGKGVAWMLLAIAAVATAAVVSKYMLATVDPWTLFAYGKLGTFFAGLPFFVPGGRAFAAAFRRHGMRVVIFTGLSEGITSMTTIFFLYAGSTGYVTLVNALISTQPFFLLLFTVILSRYWPQVIKEDIEGRLLARKALAIAMMLAGAWIVS